MKFILFCNLPYSFSILKPLYEEIIKNPSFDVIWYIPTSLQNTFPVETNKQTNNISELKRYKADVIFVPGNDVPHFLRGLKVQIFHGLAGEKKGHFRIRDYFDLYLTQGPYFTNEFKKLSKKHRNFDVIETGWSKLDKLYITEKSTTEKRSEYLKKYKSIVLFAPTFSPSLTCGNEIFDEIKTILKDKNILIITKFHDKMDKEIIEKYKSIKEDNFLISKENDITTLLQISDIMISDTSSVVYEFLLLNKPVITYNSTSEHKGHWEDIKNKDDIIPALNNILNNNDNFKEKRKFIIDNYHPYNDGLSAKRMIEESIQYIEKNGVPKKRKISLFRKIKMYKIYGFKK